MKKSLINYLGLLGVLALISYATAVIYSPRAYPGYDWMSQEISDLSAVNAPSKDLWNQLASLYEAGTVVSITLVCIFNENKLNKKLRIGIYLFGIMNWISNIGYGMFPLSDSGNAGTFIDIMHIYVVTILVIMLSIILLIIIIIGGIKSEGYRSLAIWASLSLIMMIIGAAGTMVAPKDYFGLVERINVFSVPIFNAVLGVYLYNGFKRKDKIKKDI